MTPVTYTTTDVCQNRHGGNEQSVAAYEAGKAKHPRCRQAVLDHITAQGANGATSKEIALALGQPLHTVSGRISELKQRNVVHTNGTRNGAAVLVAAKAEVTQ